MYERMYENPYAEEREGGLPPRVKKGMIDQLAANTQTAAGTLLDLISVPGSLLNDAILSRPLGSGSTAEEVLDAAGVLPDEDTLGGWGRPLASFAWAAGTDPLNRVTFGAGATNRASKAAKAAGLMDDVQRLASRRLINEIGEGTKTLGDAGGFAQSAARAFDSQFGKSLNDLTDADLLARPLVGPRMAARGTTLDELVQAQIDPDAARSAVRNALNRDRSPLNKLGWGPKPKWNEIKKSRLGGDIGIDLGPLGSYSGRLADIPLVGKHLNKIPLVGDGMASGLDRVGQAMRWSLPGRAAAATFDKSVLQRVDEGDQILAKTLSRSDELAEQAANRKIAGILQQLPERAFIPEVSRAVRQVIEGVGDDLAQANQIVDAEDLRQFVNDFGGDMRDYLRRSREAGIGSTALRDPYGAGYFPRGLNDQMFENRSAPVTGGRSYSVNTGDQIARSAAYHMPGGTRQVREISQDAAVRTAATDEDAARHIYDTVNGAGGANTTGRNLPEYTMRQARTLARHIRSARGDVVERVGFFDNHFMEDYARYIKGREKAIGRTDVILDTLATTAQPGHFSTQPGTGHRSARGVLNQLGLRTTRMADGTVQGAQQRLFDELRNRGFNLNDIDDLRNVSLDSRIVARLNRINEFYKRPELQSGFLKVLDDVTRLWKSSILSWPARFTRDRYSGWFTNFLEVGNPVTLYKGSVATQRLIQGQTDELATFLRQMPRFASLAPDEALRQYTNELAASGLLQGRRLDDIGMEMAGQQSGTALRDAYVPQASPRTTYGYQAFDLLSGRRPLGLDRTASAELTNLQGYREGLGELGRVLTGRRGVRDWLADNELRDPFLRWANKLGDTTDAMNRLDGWNALLLQGVDPMEAARRTKASQVDYGSLTNIEREWFRRLIPFWSFNSRMGKYIAQKIWEKPGGAFTQFGLRLPQELAAAGDEEGYTPKEIKESYGTSLEPLREAPGLGSIVNALAPKADNKNAYLKDVDLSGVDLINLVKLQRNASGGINPMGSGYETLLNAVSSLAHPYIRTGVEQLSGRNLFTDQSLAQYEPTLQKIGRRYVQPGGMADDAIRWAALGVEQIPHAPRLLQLMNRLTDDERTPELSARLGQGAVDLLSGVKIRNIMDDAAALDARREIDAMLDASPMLRTFSSRYIPEELRQYASPEELLLYELSKEMSREARNARKARKRSPMYENPYL